MAAVTCPFCGELPVTYAPRSVKDDEHGECVECPRCRARWRWEGARLRIVKDREAKAA